MVDEADEAGGGGPIDWKIQEHMPAGPLKYSITDKPPFAVVVFAGLITKDALEVLEKCEKDLSKRQDQFWIMLFAEVTAIDMNATGPLVRIQKILRDKGAVRLCALKPELRQYLIRKTALREAEYLETPAEALESLKVAKAKLGG